MRQPSAPPIDHIPVQVQPWAAMLVAVALIIIYALLLVEPVIGTQAARRQLHSAVSSLTTAIEVVEASYAGGDLRLNDRHLAMPTSAAHCAQLRVHLPATGHARLTCRLRETARLSGTLVLHRSPQGAWHCEADVRAPQLLPAACARRASQ